jgi:hypothetical protein
MFAMPSTHAAEPIGERARHLEQCKDAVRAAPPLLRLLSLGSGGRGRPHDLTTEPEDLLNV